MLYGNVCIIYRGRERVYRSGMYDMETGNVMYRKVYIIYRNRGMVYRSVERVCASLA